MNFSALKPAVCRYLSAHEMPRDAVPDALIEACLEELADMDSFRAVSAFYDTPPALFSEEPYASFLQDAEGCFLVACTLGVEVDRKIRRLAASDMQKMLVFDACANAYLEHCCEAWKRTLCEDVSYTFCPGYASSRLSDLQFIFRELKPEKIGMELTSANLMLPQKSMAGIVGCGSHPRPRCGDCVKQQDCVFRKEGTVCFRSEPN